MYREYKPNILLAPYIETYWATDESLSGRQTLRILPDGGINVLFNLAENEVDIIKPFIPYIIGTKTTFSNVVHERADRMIGVRFRPCAISAYTKVPVYEFNNCRVDTSLFLSLFADFNSERLAEKEDEIERLNYIEEYLLGKLNCLNNIDKQFIYVAEYIRMTNGMVPVNKLLDKVCLSQRQFDTRVQTLRRCIAASVNVEFIHNFSIIPILPLHPKKGVKVMMKNNSATINVLRDGNMMKSLVKMGLPMVISMLIMAVYNIADTFWVSHLGTIPIAAVSIVFPFALIFTGVGLTFGVGGGVFVSRLLGKKKLDEASVVASVSVLTAFMSGIFIMTFCNLFIHRILCYMGADDASINIAIGYGRLFTVCCAIGVFNVASANIFVSQGASKVSATAMITGAVVNMGLVPLFIYIFGLGVNGSTYANIASQLITALIYCWHYSRKTIIKVSPRLFKPTLAIYAEVLKIGIAMLFLQVFQAMSISLMQKASAKYGNEAVAAIGIVLKIVTLGSNIVYGFVKGFQPIAGYNYSAGNYPRLKQAIRWSLVLTTSYCILWTVVIFSFSTSIIGWFGEDVNMQKTAAEALNINTIMFFTLGFQFVYAAFYMSAGMGLHSLLLNVSRQGIIFIPIILILPTYWGLRGVLYTPMVADLLSTILTLFYAFKAKSVLYNKENPINIRMR